MARLARLPKHTYATYGLIAIFLIAYAALGFPMRTAPDAQLLLRCGALDPALMARGEWWRYVTAIFLHSQFIDFLFNMWFFWSAARMVERSLGPAHLLAIVLGTGVAGSIYAIQAKIGTLHSAEAAVFGPIGAMIGIYLRYRRAIPGPMRSAYLGFLPLLVIYGIIAYVQPFMDYRMTLAGLIPGVITPFILPRSGIFRPGPPTPDEQIGPSPMAYGSMGMMGIGVLFCYGMLLLGPGGGGALRSGERWTHPDGWSILAPAGFEAAAEGQGAKFTHAARPEVIEVRYDRPLLLASSDKALEHLRQQYGLFAGQKEKMKESVSVGTVAMAVLRAETKDSSQATAYVANEEVLRRRPLLLTLTGPPAAAEAAHSFLLQMALSLEP